MMLKPELNIHRDFREFSYLLRFKLKIRMMIKLKPIQGLSLFKNMLR